MIHKLVPIDTRSVELISALSFFLVSISTVISPLLGNESDVNIQYAFIFILLSALQVLGILCGLLFPLRVILNYVAGVIWVWLGFSMFSLASEMAHCSAISIALGIGNFYAFVIGVSILIKKKKEQESDLNG